jgi:transcriptional antiterminator NusG
MSEIDERPNVASEETAADTELDEGQLTQPISEADEDTLLEASTDVESLADVAEEIAESEETAVAAEDAVAEEAAVDDAEADEAVAEAAADIAEEEEAEAGETIPADFERGDWFVIHTYSGYENKVKTNLEHRIQSMDVSDKIYSVVIPTEEEIEIREGQRKTVAKKIFPGYVLVQMKMDDESWYVVRNTPGVTGFVAPGGGTGTAKPTPLAGGEVRNILRRMKVAAPKVKVGFSIGESVRIIEGPFQDFVGSVDEINVEKGKVKVLVSFFGRETPVELDFLQVERI